MYNIFNVVRASHKAAPCATHALREFGDGNMGAGIRKMAYQSSAITACVIGAIGAGIYGYKMVSDYRKAKKQNSLLLNESQEEEENLQPLVETTEIPV
jgi:hypothetical protein